MATQGRTGVVRQSRINRLRQGAARHGEHSAGLRSASIDFQLRDLTAETEHAARDRILFTPTLVKRSPPPSVWVLGDLSRPWIVTDLLPMCGISPLTAA